MGFNLSSTTINLVAKLTPIGRQKLVTTNSNLVSSFSLGDSDANYYVSSELMSGQVPSLAGNINTSNGVASNYNIKSFVVLNQNGSISKPIEQSSVKILTNQTSNGFNTISGSNLTHIVVDRLNTTNSYVNLFYSLGLPLTDKEVNTYSGVSSTFGGYSDTSYSALGVTNVGVIAINNNTYGEVIDGKTIKVTIPTSSTTYNIYGTFKNKNANPSVEDNNINETSPIARGFGDNIVFLFSDEIQTPNGSSATTWSSGYNLLKPYSLNNKNLFSDTTLVGLGLSADTIVGMVHLDKGIITILNPQILSDMGGVMDTGTTVSFNSLNTQVSQIFTCIAERGEFGASTNRTFALGDSPRISEVGLYDSNNNLIAIGKLDRHVTKNINEFLALSIKIEL
jgi:hypothetical protein